MTMTAEPSVQRVPPKLAWRTLVKWGLIGGLIAVFICSIGMFLRFNQELVIDPWLSLGYLSLLWIPIYYGYKVSIKPVLEGVEPEPPGPIDVAGGAITGAIAGASLGAFILLSSVVYLRDILLNVSPALVELLSIGGSAASGALVYTAAGAVLGALGGGLHLLSPGIRGLVGTAMSAVLAMSFLDLVVGDILRSAGFRNIDQMIYAQSRGLKPAAAIVIAVVAVALRLALRGRGPGMRQRAQSLAAQRRNLTMLVVGAGLIGLGAFLPSLFGTFLNDLLANVGLFVLLALGLNIVVGFAGLLDVGYVAFFAVGAYTTGVLTSPRSPAITPEMAFFEAMPWVLLMAVIAGLIIGTPVIRMRGDYLAIVTLGFGEIARIALASDWLRGVFGGSQGIERIAPLGDGTGAWGIRIFGGYVLIGVGIIVALIAFLRWMEGRRISQGALEPVAGRTYPQRTSAVIGGIGVALIAIGAAFPTFVVWTVVGLHPPAMFRITLVFAAIAVFVSIRLRDSRLGRAWMAVREDEQVAQAMGINIVTTKLLAFITGAMLASLGGALFAVKLGTIFPDSFEIVQSIIILVIVIVGGMGSIRGVIVGAVVLIGILGGPKQVGLLDEFSEFKLLMYGAILVWMMLKRPEGLWPEARRAQELHSEEMMQDAWLRATPTSDEGEGA